MASTEYRWPATWTAATPTKHKTAASVEHGLQGLLAVNRAMESTLIDVVAAYIPWLGSFIPASIGWTNVQVVLGFTPLQAWIYAIVVEGMGLATVATTLTFWEWNQDDNKKQAPFALSLITAAVYLAIVLGVNVLLDPGTPLVRGVKALASSISVVGALIVAMRSQQAKLRIAAENELAAVEQGKLDAQARQVEQNAQQLELAKIEAQKVAETFRVEAEIAEKDREAERNIQKEIKLAEIAAKVSIKAAKLSTTVSEGSESGGKVSESGKDFPETFGKWADWRQVPLEHKKRIAGMTIQQVAREYGCIEKTAGNWIRAAKLEFGTAPGAR